MEQENRTAERRVDASTATRRTKEVYDKYRRMIAVRITRAAAVTFSAQPRVAGNDAYKIAARAQKEIAVERGDGNRDPLNYRAQRWHRRPST